MPGVQFLPLVLGQRAIRSARPVVQRALIRSPFLFSLSVMAMEQVMRVDVPVGDFAVEVHVLVDQVHF
jgi:hypothetical protein